jgi:predicted nucleic-acid-binding Zn-ribbon protein
MAEETIGAQLSDNKEKINFGYVARALDKKWSESRKCPICGHEEWNISDKIFTLRGLNKFSEAYPVIAVICDNCGYSHFFNPLVLGIFDQEEGDCHE